MFQLKIFLDGLKDIVLAPLGLVAGAIGLLGGSTRPGRYLYWVMRLGKRYEDWIGLYGALDRKAKKRSTKGLDGYIERMERALVAQSQQGGLTTQARAALEKALDVLDAGTTDAASAPSNPGTAATPTKDEA